LTHGGARIILKDKFSEIRGWRTMQKYLKKIMAVIVTLAIIITSMPINTYAQENKMKSSIGEYLIINSKLNKLAYYKNGKLIKEFRVAT
jgi:predicted methyltransferase